MNKTELLNKMTRSLSKTGFKLKKHSPEILAAVGTVGVVASTVMACKATMKVNEILDEASETLEQIHDGVEKKKKLKDGTEYTEEIAKKDTALVYVQTGVKFGKLYGPAVAVGVASLGCLLTSNHILRKRNFALAAAYTAIDKSYKAYRGRVAKRFGDEVEREIRYNIQAKEVEVVNVDENGTETIEKTIIDVPNFDEYSEYARCFDETCLGWTRDAEYNHMFVKQIQNWANDKLRAKGFLFLNDVYEMLGMQKSRAGQVVGWVYDENGETSDTYIDFGIYNLKDKQKRRFVNGYEKSIWLDFNVDGKIIDLLA